VTGNRTAVAARTAMESHKYGATAIGGDGVVDVAHVLQPLRCDRVREREGPAGGRVRRGTETRTVSHDACLS
jgi:hypothetical protein